MRRGRSSSLGYSARMTNTKQALSTAEDSQAAQMKSISTCTRRIAFLGTPHQGSDKAKWVDLGKRFLSMVSQKTTADILKELEQGSDTLVRLGVAFPKWLSHQAEHPETKVEIVCFFEELSTDFGSGSLGKVRQLTSATVKERRLTRHRSCRKTRHACWTIRPSQSTRTTKECANSTTKRKEIIRKWQTFSKGGQTS